MKNIKKRKIYARFKDNIWAADLAEMRFLSSFSCGVKFLLCAVDVFTEHAWFKPLKYKKAKKVLYHFATTANESKRNPNKLWVDHGREFHKSTMQTWSCNNDISMYSSYNEGKSVVAERFIKI